MESCRLNVYWYSLDNLGTILQQNQVLIYKQCAAYMLISSGERILDKTTLLFRSNIYKRLTSIDIDMSLYSKCLRAFLVH